MSEALLLRNFVAFLFQTSVVAGIGATLPWALRLRSPRPLLYYWQMLLALIVLLPMLQYWAAPGQVAAGALPAFIATAGESSAMATASRASWILTLLAAGAVLKMAWIGLGLWRLGQYRRRSVPAAVHSGEGAEIRVCRRIPGPVSFGLLRPVILLPGSWEALAPELREVVVCHELVHIWRKDWPWHVAEEFIGAALWFHPAIWYLIGKIRSVREQVVDQEVIAQTHSPGVYIDALLALAGPAAGVPAPCFARKNELVERIQKLKKEYSMSTLRAAVSFAGVALVLLAGERAAIWSFPLQAAQTEGSGSGKVYRVGKGVTPPSVLTKSDPEYTTDAKDAKIEGTVLLYVEITPDGLARNIQVKKSLEPGLDSKAVEAISKWRFSPGTKDGELVTVGANIEVNFRLK